MEESVWLDSLDSLHVKPLTLPKTNSNSAPENSRLKGTYFSSCQPSNFQVLYLLVSGRAHPKKINGWKLFFSKNGGWKTSSFPIFRGGNWVNFQENDPKSSHHLPCSCSPSPAPAPTYAPTWFRLQQHRRRGASEAKLQPGSAKHAQGVDLKTCRCRFFGWIFF